MVGWKYEMMDDLAFTALLSLINYPAWARRAWRCSCAWALTADAVCRVQRCSWRLEPRHWRAAALCGWSDGNME
jgi:hypothetical protein